MALPRTCSCICGIGGVLHSADVFMPKVLEDIFLNIGTVEADVSASCTTVAISMQAGLRLQPGQERSGTSVGLLAADLGVLVVGKVGGGAQGATKSSQCFHGLRKSKL